MNLRMQSPSRTGMVILRIQTLFRYIPFLGELTARNLRRLMCNSEKQGRSRNRMLRPYLDQKAVLAYGPRLPPRLIEYVLTEDWSKATHAPDAARLGRPSLISDPEILTLAILAQWPRFRSERDFWVRKRPTSRVLPRVPSQSQFNRRARALEAEMKALAPSGGRPRRTLRRLPRRSRHHPDSGHREGQGVPEGTLLRAGEFRAVRLEDGVVTASRSASRLPRRA